MLIGEGSGGTQLPMKRGSGAELCRCGIQLKGDMCLKCPPTSSILLMRTSIKTANEVMLSCSAKVALPSVGTYPTIEGFRLVTK